MTDLQKQLKEIIERNGPISVETFMGLVTAHYYSTRDPFGAKADFTTAPEISQMFGEMIGVFAADAWIKMGSPASFTLLECGPGRGTLMADIMRATRHVPGFHEAAKIVLMEISPILRGKQQEALKDYPVEWVTSTDSQILRSSDSPIILIANEFLDALPMQQWIWAEDEWRERAVSFENDQFVLCVLPLHPSQPFPPCMGGRAKGGGDVWEQSPARETFVKKAAELLRARTGVALFIDYGHDVSGCGDTLQAVKDHKFVDVLDHIGEADLTSHVDFDALKKAVSGLVTVHGPVGQGVFLKRLGIELRAQRLNQPDELARLTAPDQMGNLFRVLAFCSEAGLSPEGF